MARNIILSLITSITLGYAFWHENNTTWTNIYAIIAAIFFIIAILQVVVVINSRKPLAIFHDKVKLATIGIVSVPREHITGIGTYPKNGKPCLNYNNTESGYKGPMQLPWNIIAEDEAEVVAVLQKELKVPIQA